MSGIRFSILLLPILKPRADWYDQEKLSRSTALSIFNAHNIRYFDLMQPLEQALAQGVDCQEGPGDAWHPSDEVSDYFAQYLEKQGLLE